MADKIITELQLISALTDECNLPVVNTIQTYRGTMVQVYNYIKAKLEIVRTFTTHTALASSDRIIFLNPTSAPFTQTLPACASHPVGPVTFKNIALPSNGNAATLDANSTELIDDEETLVLNSFPSMDSVTLYNNGTKWLRIG